MATKSYKKKRIVAGSPAIQEHEAMMQEVMNEQPVNASRSDCQCANR